MESIELSLRDWAVPGQKYVLRIHTDGIPEPARAYDILKRELYDRFRIEVTGMDVRNGTVELQFVAGLPFAWSTLIEYLPLILRMIGATLIGIDAFLIIGKIRPLEWFLLILGTVLLLFSGQIVRAVRVGWTSKSV